MRRTANAQPWRFSIATGHIDILPAFDRRTPVVDPDDHHLYVSLGCAAENMAQAARAGGCSGAIETFSGSDGVRVRLDPSPVVASAMFDAIPRRQSTQSDFGDRRVGTADLRTLAEAAKVPGVSLTLMTDRKAIGRIRDLVVAGNDVQMADPAFLRELAS